MAEDNVVDPMSVGLNLVSKGRGCSMVRVRVVVEVNIEIPRTNGPVPASRVSGSQRDVSEGFAKKRTTVVNRWQGRGAGD